MLTVHRSETNVSKDIRWTLQYRYYPAMQVAEAKLDPIAIRAQITTGARDTRVGPDRTSVLL